MSELTPDRVDALAVETAIQIVKSLDGKQEISPEELTALRTEVGATGLLLGFSSIVLSLVRLIDDHPEEFTFTDSIGIDQRVTGSSLIPAVLTSLSKKRVRERDLPTAAGALAAAAVRIPPSVWRLLFGPVAEEELEAWARLAWFLSTLIDRTRQDDGLALNVVRDTIDMAVANPVQEESPSDDN